MLAVNDPLKLPDERMLFQFSEATDLARWRSFQDSDSGGESTISLTANPDESVMLEAFSFPVLTIASC